MDERELSPSVSGAAFLLISKRVVVREWEKGGAVRFGTNPKLHFLLLAHMVS